MAEFGSTPLPEGAAPDSSERVTAPDGIIAWGHRHGQWIKILVPMAIIFIAETFLFFKNLEMAATIHALNLLLCVMYPILMKDDPYLWQAFSMASILRILNIGMPRFDTLTLYWIPLIYAPAIIVAVFLLKDDEKSYFDYMKGFKSVLHTKGKKFGWKHYYLPLGILIGWFLSNIEFKVLGTIELVPELSLYYLAILAIVMILFVGLGEELIFRYILQGRLETKLGIVVAIVLSSFIFATMHSGYDSVPYAAYVFCVSLFIGILYFRTKSLGFVALVHGALNFFLFSFLPFGYLRLF